MTTAAMFRPGQARQVVGVSARTMYRWANAGHITLYRRGKCSFFKTDEVVKFITGLGDELGDID